MDKHSNNTYYELKKYIDFNLGWKFKLFDFGHIELKDLIFDEFEDVDLPHDWSIYLDFNQNSLSRNEGGLLDGGLGYYYKKFSFDESIADKRVRIKFGGVYMDSSVYLNGELIGNYPFGYNTFTYDITDYIHFGENEIIVKVENRQPSSRWYSGSGIYRNVELIITKDIFFCDNGIKIIPHIDSNNYLDKVNTEVEYEVRNSSFFDKEISLEYEVIFGEKVIFKSARELNIKRKSDQKIIENFTLDTPVLWSIKNPSLYYLKSRIIVNGKVFDESINRYGYRFFKWNREGFHLNGKYLKFHGVCLHHDNGCLGAELYEKADRRKLEILKDMGVNSIRTSHNPQSEEFIRLCDEMGILVIEEAFDTWHGKPKKEFDYNRFFNKTSTHPRAQGEVNAEFDIKSMVKRDYNSPSILMWSIGNEIWETEEEYGIEQAKKLIKWVKEVDDKRFVTIGENKLIWSPEKGPHIEICNMLDVVGMNYAEANIDKISELYPDWLIYGSETSSAVKSRGIYYNPSNKDNISTGSADKHNRKYQMSDYGNDRVGWGRTAIKSWIPDRDHRNYAGQFIWTGFDYIGEPTPWHNEENLGVPCKSSYFGIVDLCGFPKNDYYFYQSQWINKNDKFIVKILPHWNFSDREILKLLGTDIKSEEIPVRVFSNLPRIELKLNGKSLGEKSFTQKTTSYGHKYQEGESEEELYLEWNVKFEKGVIEAIGKDEDGRVCSIDKIETSKIPAAVKLLPEQRSIYSDDDIAYIEFRIVDENGNPVPYADNLVYFEAEGCGEIIGVDNGNPASLERFKVCSDGRWKRRAFSGRGIVVLKPNKCGDIVLRAYSEDLIYDEVKIHVIEGKSYNYENICKNQLGMDYIADDTDSEIYYIPTISKSADFGEKIVLPDKMKAILKNQSYAFIDVKWQEIPDIEEVGEYFIQGKNEDFNQVVKLKLRVNDYISAENHSMAISKNQIPSFPEYINLYSTSGDIKKAKVSVWNKESEKNNDEDSSVENFTFTASLENGLMSKLAIRLTDETMDSYNYAKAWNGSELPAGIASFTNSGEGSVDSVISLNNEIVSYDSKYMDRWTNISNPKRECDWAGILLGRAGELKKHRVNKIKIAFFEDYEVSSPKSYKLEYFNTDEVRIPKDYANVLEDKDNPLSYDRNWTEIKSFNKSEEEIFEVFNFDDIDTFAIRIKMFTKEDYRGIGITEIQVYGREAVANKQFNFDIYIDEEKFTGIKDDKYRYYFNVKRVPKFEVITDNNASSTIIPAIGLNDKTVLLMKNEANTEEKRYEFYWRKND